MSELADAIGRAVIADAGLEDRPALEPDDHLALIAASSRGEEAARILLHRAVGAARAGGASWAVIGSQLGMTRQAAQQRFGVPGPAIADDEAERWLGPVNAFDEMAELDAAGRAGWHTVEAGMLSHRMVRTDTRWEHRRILWRGRRATEESDGWQIGCRAFPWVYLIRDTGLPAEPVDDAGR